MRKTHWAIDKVTDDIGERFSFNTAQSAVHELVGVIQDHAADATGEQLRFACGTAVGLIHPYAPHIACELWERLGGERLWDEPWPVADPAMLARDTVVYAVQVGGKLRGEVEVPAGAAEDDGGGRRPRRAQRGRAPGRQGCGQGDRSSPAAWSTSSSADRPGFAGSAPDRNVPAAHVKNVSP